MVEQSSQVDYSYGFDKAVKDGYLCDMQSFILPLVARSKEEEYAKLAKIVKVENSFCLP